MMQARGSDCFNFELYQSKNSLPFGDSTSLWTHFVDDGQFEGRTFEFTCWQAGKRPSPVDGQWYPLHNSTTPPKQKGRLSVHLKLPKNKPQWKLQTQLQQKLDAHPELADAADSKERTLSGHNQSALEDPDRRPAFAMDAQQNQSTAVTQQGRQHHS
ncbi:hypothetical protein ABBQ32_009743 [Trebouxia sp. C0010 RCD-2024]